MLTDVQTPFLGTPLLPLTRSASVDSAAAGILRRTDEAAKVCGPLHMCIYIYIYTHMLILYQYYV